MPRPATRGPRQLGKLLPPELRKAFRARGFAEAGVLTEWPAIVGEDLAARSCPERLGRDGTLRVRLEGGAALEFQHLAPQILERIATFFGYRAVNRMTLVQGPLPPRRKPARPSLRALDASEEAALRARIADIEDPALKAALDRLGRAVLGTSRPP